MTIYAALRVKLKELRVARSPLVTTLQTVIGALDNKYRVAPTDKDVTAMIRSFIKNWKDTLNLTTDVEAVAKLSAEIELIESFVPALLNKEQLESLLTADMKLLGDYMSFLNKTYPGQIDGKLASEVFKARNS